MKGIRSFVGIVAIVVLCPMLALAQKVSFDFDKEADFSKFKTFTQKDGTKVGDPLIDNRIVAAIDAQMKSRGLVRNDAKPDVVVVYHIGFDKQQDITTYSSGYGGYGYRWGGGWGTTDVRVNEILVGTLVIDVADANMQEVVWRGIGVKEVDVQAKPEKRDKNIKEAVKKIFKNFPPKKKS